MTSLAPYFIPIFPDDTDDLVLCWVSEQSNEYEYYEDKDMITDDNFIPVRVFHKSKVESYVRMAYEGCSEGEKEEVLKELKEQLEENHK
jgi:hypothetical protein